MVQGESIGQDLASLMRSTGRVETNSGSKDLQTTAALNASDIKITLNKDPKTVPAFGSAEQRSQRVCTDHMVQAVWSSDEGWTQPEIKPYGPLLLMPSANVLHYATQCFEGMKIYRGFDGKLRLFRPYANCLRMAESARRISLPEFEPGELLKMIKKLCAVDGPKWLPKHAAGSYMYVRPAMIGTDPCIGFEIPKEALLYAIITYWPQPPKATLGRGLRLFTSREDEVRAWPGGSGYAKIGPNYGPALLAHGEAKRLGYDQVLWLFGPDSQITEAGSSNVFVIRRSRQGNLELTTAPLSGNIILAGITRQSILDLARQKFNANQEIVVDGRPSSQVEALEVVERSYTMTGLISDLEEGRLLAIFVVGTAASVAEVSEINYRGQVIHIATDATAHVSLLREWITGIMYGKLQSAWADVIEEAE